MAALTRSTKASYEVHETVKVDTSDNEDHTFCGIMFPVKAKNILPVETIIIHSVAVRGQLGPLTVWVSSDDEGDSNDGNAGGTTNRDNNGGGGGDNAAAGGGNNDNDNNHQRRNRTTRDRNRRRGGENNNNNNLYRFPLSSRHWTKVYENVHAPSQRKYVTLDFSSTPIVLKPGQVRAIYVHSKLEGDEAIVYDNTRLGGDFGRTVYWNQRGAVAETRPRYEDAMISIHSGKAHLSPTPFGQMPIWGWGNAWRDRREFVGQVQYGAVYKLWSPLVHSSAFSNGGNFEAAVRTLLACQRRSRKECPVAMLPDECLYYILHMCRWDWFDDNASSMRLRKIQRKKRRRQQAREQERRRREAAEAAAAATEQERQRRDRGAERNAAHAPLAQPQQQGPDEPATALGNEQTSEQATSCCRTTCCGARQQDEDDEEDMFYDAEEEIDNDADDDDDEEWHLTQEDACDDEAMETTHRFDDDDFDDEEDDEDDDDDEELPDHDDEDEEISDIDAEEEYERAHGYRADGTEFTYEDHSSGDSSSGEEDDDEDDDEESRRNIMARALGRQAWFQHAARIQIIRALVQDD